MNGFGEQIRGRLIVSCQASEGEAFRSAESMARFAAAARDGGAGGIRASGPEDVAAIVRAVGLPVIGIQKRVVDDGRVLITPTFEDARALVEAGAAAVALDCTVRGQARGALERLRRIKAELGVAVCADIATEEEARAAERAGADFVLSTMRGYTAETASVRRFEASFIARLRAAAGVPVIAEGMIARPEEARAAMEAGAWAVIVGTAITRPHELTRGFAAAVEVRRRVVGAIDMGATRTKSGVVRECGELVGSAVCETPAAGVLEHLVEVARRVAGEGVEALGVAVAGWPDESGRIAFATEGIAGWRGADVRGALERATGLRVFVENDARAFAVGERRWGAAAGADDAVCLTLGTGVGGGVWAAGRLVRGARGLGSALGHIVIERGGAQCLCGRRGCLEAYAGAAAMVAGTGYETARALMEAAGAGEAAARAAVARHAERVLEGCRAMAAAFDPAVFVLGGGLAEGNAILMDVLRGGLEQRVERARLGYEAGVVGAAAVAFEGM